MARDRDKNTTRPEKDWKDDEDSPIELSKMSRFNFKVICWSLALDVLIKIIHQLYITGVWDYHNNGFDHSMLALSYFMDVIVFMVVFNTSVSKKR